MIVVAIIVIVLTILAAGFVGWASDSVGLGILYGAVAGIVAALVVGAVSLGYNNPRDLTCHVEDKDRAAKDGGSDMRIYTRECGVLKVQDLFWALRFDSADVFASIEPGHTYRFHITGVRVPLLSVFPNIRTVERVS